MYESLQGRKVAILVADGFEQSEMEEPCFALECVGAEIDLISPQRDEVRAWSNGQFEDSFVVDVPLKRANSGDYDALLLPGGVLNLDRLGRSPSALEFVRAFFDAGKPVAAICRAPQLLIAADVVSRRMLTSSPSIKTMLLNAGAHWVDEKAVTDRGLVTGRSPEDLPDFTEKMIEVFTEGVRAAQFA
jgi:protease I